VVSVLEILDFIVAQCETELPIHLFDLVYRDKLYRSRRDVLEQPPRLGIRAQHRFGHAVVKRGGEGLAGAGDGVRGAALDALHLAETAVAGDIGRLRRPGREGADPRHHQIEIALSLFGWSAVGEQALEPRSFGGAQLARAFDEVAVLGHNRAHAGIDFLQGRDELGEAKLRQRPRASELEDVGH
jgi:hypothetical protein